MEVIDATFGKQGTKGKGVEKRRNPIQGANNTPYSHEGS